MVCLTPESAKPLSEHIEVALKRLGREPALLQGCYR